MRNFDIIKSFIGKDLQENELKNVDYYVTKNMGLFIPTMGLCGYSQRENHSHPSYMLVIFFNKDTQELLTEKASDAYYDGYITSPDVCHNDFEFGDYYCVLINKEYFEEQFLLYSDSIPKFENRHFSVCHDILKSLNTFAFEYSKKMINSHITLNAQATIITHWLIRSVIGENLDLRAISSNYRVARVQHYLEGRYSENITIAKLAKILNMSESSFNRLFKKELGITPFEYLIELRIEKSKILLRRKENSVTDVALRCGFSSSSHFSTAFAKITGTTPTDYRSKYV